MRRLIIPAALSMAVLVVVPATGHAQLPPLPLPSSSPTPSPSPTPTQRPAPSPSPSTKPKPPSRPTQPPALQTGGGSTPSSLVTKPATPSAEIASDVQEWLTRPKLPSRTTTRLLQLLEQEKGGAPLTLDDLRRGFAPFPVLGYVWMGDDYGAPRYSPFYVKHAGTDIFAPRGTPVVAVADGLVWKMNIAKPVSGNGLWLQQPSGAYFYYGHFDRFAPGIVIGKHVRMGDVIGYVGNTGAPTTPTHCHFEVHPTGTKDG
ncbi:MAG: M23 family metallopeptidase, partial [Actinomycetota bacterium]